MTDNIIKLAALQEKGELSPIAEDFDRARIRRTARRRIALRGGTGAMAPLRRHPLGTG